MFYLGAVTPKQFVHRLSQKLRLYPELPNYRLGLHKDNQSARMLLSIQDDSKYIIRASVEVVDIDSLYVCLDLAEVVAIPHTNQTCTIGNGEIYSVVLGSSERKRLRQLCDKLACLMAEHTGLVKNLCFSDFMSYSFVDSSPSDIDNAP